MKKKPLNTMYLIKFLVKITWINAKPILLLTSFIIFLQGITPIISIWINGKLIENVFTSIQNREFTSDLKLWIFAFGLASLVQNSFFAINPYLNNVLKESVGTFLQRRLLDKVQSKRLTDIENPIFQAKLQRAQEFITNRLNNFISGLTHLGYLLVAVCSSLIIVYYINWKFVPIIIISVIPVFYLRICFEKLMYHMYRRQQPRGRIADYLFNVLVSNQSFIEINVFKLKNYIFNEYRNIQNEISKERTNHFLRHGFLGGGIEGTIITVAYIICLVIAARDIISGVISITSFVVIVQAIQYSQDELLSLGYNIKYLYDGTLYGKDLVEILNDEERKQISKDSSDFLEESPFIRVQNVSYVYQGCEKQSLDDVTFDIYTGEIIAIVGPNGSGKSTLAKLILGLYYPTKGKIVINGKDTRDWDCDELREIVSAVFQDFNKYELTIKDNIGFGKHEYINNNSKIKQSANKSNASRFIEKLPDKYDTAIGTIIPDSIHLSGGQWQTLAITRSIFSSSKMYVLDEPTSSLDPISEAKLYLQYKEIVKDATAMLISHRLGSARIADRIIVLNEGKLIEIGNHGDLIKNNGQYKKMFETQAKWYQ